MTTILIEALNEVLALSGRAFDEAAVKLIGHRGPALREMLVWAQEQRAAVDYAIECLQRYTTMLDPECMCDPCPTCNAGRECGKMPHECSGTDCAQRCQCNECDHCRGVAAIEALRAATKEEPNAKPLPQAQAPLYQIAAEAPTAEAAKDAEIADLAAAQAGAVVLQEACVKLCAQEAKRLEALKWSGSNDLMAVTAERLEEQIRALTLNATAAGRELLAAKDAEIAQWSQGYVRRNLDAAEHAEEIVRLRHDIARCAARDTEQLTELERLRPLAEIWKHCERYGFPVTEGDRYVALDGDSRSYFAATPAEAVQRAMAASKSIGWEK